MITSILGSQKDNGSGFMETELDARTVFQQLGCRMGTREHYQLHSDLA